MRFDPLKWKEIDLVQDFTQAPQGRLHLMCSKDCTLWVSALGYEAIAGHGKEINIQTSKDMTFRIDGLEVGVDKAFYYVPESLPLTVQKEIYTNIDRKPTESGTVLAVKAAIRSFKLEQQAILAEIEAERSALNQQRFDNGRIDELPPEDADPVPDPEPDPV